VDFPDVDLPVKDVFSVSMVALLLQHGASPNVPSTHNATETIWQTFLGSLYVIECDAEDWNLSARVIEALLRGGADPRVACVVPQGCGSTASKNSTNTAMKRPTVRKVIRDIFEKRGLVNAAASLLAVLREVQLAQPMKGKSQRAVVSTTTKNNQGILKKRSLVNGHLNAAADDNGPRRPLKRSCRRRR
jgi:hypothetical protein